MKSTAKRLEAAALAVPRAEEKVKAARVRLEEVIVDAYAEGQSVASIARVVGSTRQYVYNVLGRHDVALDPGNDARKGPRK